MRAFAGARFVLDYHVTIVDASRWTGSNPVYVAALLEVIATDDAALLRAVLRGHVPVPLAAERAKKLNRLVEAYREATPATKVAFCKFFGQEKLFDELIAPAIEAATSEAFWADVEREVGAGCWRRPNSSRLKASLRRRS
jgi:hypothetical protein